MTTTVMRLMKYRHRLFDKAQIGFWPGRTPLQDVRSCPTSAYWQAVSDRLYAAKTNPE